MATVIYSCERERWENNPEENEGLVELLKKYELNCNDDFRVSNSGALRLYTPITKSSEYISLKHIDMTFFDDFESEFNSSVFIADGNNIKQLRAMIKDIKNLYENMYGEFRYAQVSNREIE